LTVLSLEGKERISLDILAEALAKAKNPYTLFTGAVDSLVLLHLIKQLQKRTILFPVLHIDTTIEFPEVYQFIEKMRKLWGFRLVRERNKN
jgi:sulfate adenylyltransferase subunit 2